RRAVRARADEAGSCVKHAGNAVNLGGLEGFFERERRKDAGDTFGQHGLARTGRADHEDVVAAGARYFQRALGSLLATNFFEIGTVLLITGENFRRVYLYGRNAVAAIEKAHH